MAGSPSGLPALFSACRKAMLVAAGVAILGCALPAQAASTDEAAGYRLAGVIVTGADRMGFLSIPGGSQVLIRQGSVLPDGSRVVAFSDRVLRLQVPGGGVIELSLARSGAASAVAVAASPASQSETVPAASPTSSEVVTRARDKGPVLMRTVSPTPLRAALKPRIADARAHAGEKGAPRPTDVVAATFRELMDLPKDSELLSVNGKPVTSAAEVLETVQKSLSSKTMVTLHLSSPSGPQRVYLMPDVGAQLATGG